MSAAIAPDYIALIALLVSICALAFSLLNHSRQLKESNRIHKQQIALAQRRALYDVWDRMLRTDFVTDDSSNNAKKNAVNLIEIIALSARSDLLDEDVLFDAFATVYTDLYDSYKKLTKPWYGPKDEKRIAPLSLHAVSVYEEIKDRIELEKKKDILKRKEETTHAKIIDS